MSNPGDSLKQAGIYVDQLAEKFLMASGQSTQERMQARLNYLGGIVFLGFLTVESDRRYTVAERLNGLYVEHLADQAIAPRTKPETDQSVAYTGRQWRNITRLVAVNIFDSRDRNVAGQVDMVDVLRGLAEGDTHIQ